MSRHPTNLRLFSPRTREEARPAARPGELVLAAERMIRTPRAESDEQMAEAPTERVSPVRLHLGE